MDSSLGPLNIDRADFSELSSRLTAIKLSKNDKRDAKHKVDKKHKKHKKDSKNSEEKRVKNSKKDKNVKKISDVRLSEIPLHQKQDNKTSEKGTHNDKQSHDKYKLCRERIEKLEHMPDGYVEDCSALEDNSLRSDHKSKHSNKGSKEAKQLPTSSFVPVSFILTTNVNIKLEKASSYDIHFSTGMIEGSGISINAAGNVISFEQDGSYRFEICGEAVCFSDVDARLVYFNSGFTKDMVPFSETNIPKDNGKLLLRGISTILPISKGQQVIPRIIPTPDESMVVLSGIRLLIHRVA
jgi:hypothetical protein